MFDNARKNTELSESIIKQAHRLLTNCLKRSDGREVKAGEYRDIFVHTGNSRESYNYVDPEKVPEEMKKFVLDYKTKQADATRDPYHLAAWVLHTFLGIHPFEDGNGRIACLLWCSSLIRDGIPFPLTPLPGKSKAYKIYLSCIDKDREGLRHCIRLATLTAGSVAQTWKCFLLNLQNSSPVKYETIKRCLQEARVVI